MSNVPADLKYARSHEWAREQADGSIEVGVSDHAQHALGDLVFVELPEVGRTLKVGEACAVVESVKAASDIYSPVSGEVAEVNEALHDAPEWVNEDSYAQWLFTIKPSNLAELDALLDAAAYLASTETP